MAAVERASRQVTTDTLWDEVLLRDAGSDSTPRDLIQEALGPCRAVMKAFVPNTFQIHVSICWFQMAVQMFPPFPGVPALSTELMCAV